MARLITSCIVPPSVSEPSSEREQEGPPLFMDIEGMVHIGNQNFVPSEKWQHLLRIPRDSLFCKEGARSLCTPLELRVRSLTGLPCRRFIHAKEGPPPCEARHDSAEGGGAGV
ncbi:uncharacterized protein LOC144177968 [Haemaphysalis longicornis]